MRLIIFSSLFLLFSCNDTSSDDNENAGTFQPVDSPLQTTASIMAPTADQCSDILQWGIWDYNAKFSDEEFAQKTIEWFNSNKVFSKNKTYDYAGNMNIVVPLEGVNIPMNMDGTFGVDRSEYFSDAFAYFIENNVNYRKKYIEENIKADEGIVKAWSRCMEQHRGKLLMGHPIYTSTPENRDEKIKIEVRAQVRSSDLGKLKFDKEKIKKSIVDNGCTLIGDIDDDIVQGDNSFFIKRPKEIRKEDVFITLRALKQDGTVDPEFRDDVHLMPTIVEEKPVITNEIGTNNELSDEDKSATGSNELTKTISNQKGRDVYLRVEAEVHFSNLNNETVQDIYLKGKRDGNWETLASKSIVRYTGPQTVPLKYSYDIPFYKGSSIQFKAAFEKWTGGGIDIDGSYIIIRWKY